LAVIGALVVLGDGATSASAEGSPGQYIVVLRIR
jgi:hypothetical protein